jgi:hypothetical protein
MPIRMPETKTGGQAALLDVGLSMGEPESL